MINLGAAPTIFNIAYIRDEILNIRDILYLSNQILFKLLDISLALAGDNLDLDLVAIGLLHEALAELLLGVRHVAGPLWVIRLLLDLGLELRGHKEIGGGVRVIPGIELDLSSGHDLDIIR